MFVNHLSEVNNHTKNRKKKELQRQRLNRQDFLADTRSLEVESNAYGSTLHISLEGKTYGFGIGELAHQQIASRLNIPFRYYAKMQSEAPDLLDQNVNRWLNQNPERRMIRVLDGKVRAFLSDRYRRLDNFELCAAVLPVINEMKNSVIESCEVTPTHLYLKVVNRRLKAEVKVGDVIQAGFVVSNSEVGLGSLRVEPLVFRLVCKNGLICKDMAQKKYHVGRQVYLSDDSAYELYSEETLAQDDKAFFMKVQDVVRSAVDEARFMLTVNKMREATQIPLKHEPVKAVELLADKFQLTESERGDILRQLFMGADNSRYGLVNAVTAASKIAKTYERATDLERIGGEILALPVSRNILPPPTISSYQALPEYQAMTA
ncbi:MAG: DUF932 domain-containing protein [Selenomonadaceae bacterium]|nr:DUF932 domain-containing protein [Selenomonadaceae bacterium]